jgi:hypothetical protein
MVTMLRTIILGALAIVVQVTAAPINFELRNHEPYLITVKVFQKAGARLVDQKQVRSGSQSFVTQLPAKKGSQIKAVSYSIDQNKPTFVRISYYANGFDVDRYFGLPASRTLFVAFKGGKLVPQQGILFGKVTSSGYSLSNNVKEREIVELNKNDVALIENNSIGKDRI